jgi:hypothetical protein
LTGHPLGDKKIFDLKEIPLRFPSPLKQWPNKVLFNKQPKSAIVLGERGWGEGAGAQTVLVSVILPYVEKLKVSTSPICPSSQRKMADSDGASYMKTLVAIFLGARGLATGPSSKSKVAFAES